MLKRVREGSAQLRTVGKIEGHFNWRQLRDESVYETIIVDRVVGNNVSGRPGNWCMLQIILDLQCSKLCQSEAVDHGQYKILIHNVNSYFKQLIQKSFNN